MTSWSLRIDSIDTHVWKKAHRVIILCCTVSINMYLFINLLMMIKKKNQLVISIGHSFIFSFSDIEKDTHISNHVVLHIHIYLYIYTIIVHHKVSVLFFTNSQNRPDYRRDISTFLSDSGDRLRRNRGRNFPIPVSCFRCHASRISDFCTLRVSDRVLSS
jgi:hypothetical protein